MVYLNCDMLSKIFIYVYINVTRGFNFFKYGCVVFSPHTLYLINVFECVQKTLRKDY